jgi:hypothetical protein
MNEHCVEGWAGNRQTNEMTRAHEQTLLLERRANQRALLGDRGALLGRGFARAHRSNQLAKLDRHWLDQRSKSEVETNNTF